ncbi:MAG: Bifunctional hydroxymethylpyrimidine kinase/phosphomethylpyrimidine kinase [Myxococcaceae bacterium]|nr:Bifunctional hydroxymethylpyrimidine kinase/phosphomethylpyrimidine kinase [Myxococcaceae bacterium]
MNARPLCALTIAGSDSGGGAGIQADLKTFAAHRVHGLSVIAALTAQNTQTVSAVHVPPGAFLRAQLEAVFSDFQVGAVKLGMLATREVIEEVAAVLEQQRTPHVVLDPVMIASSGARLLEPSALDALRTRLLPLATLLTPNIPEAELLLGHAIEDGEAASSALDALLALGVPAVLLKGGHLHGQPELIDRFGDGTERAEFRHPRLPLEAHGTGCTLASAIAAQLCRGETLLQACRLSADYVHGALRAAYFPGRAQLAVLDHFWARDALCAPSSMSPEMAP